MKKEQPYEITLIRQLNYHEDEPIEIQRMKKETITIELEYGSDFQAETFSTLINDTIFTIGNFMRSKHKGNKVTINGEELTGIFEDRKDTGAELHPLDIL